jgi:hypothetical protein
MLGVISSPPSDLRPSLWRLLTRLPLVVLRALRWRVLRGGWLPGFLRRGDELGPLLRRGVPIDVMVLVSDHFEPARRFGDDAAVESVRSWCAEYERLAGRHRDADGRPPQHTWFYRYDYPNPGCVQALSGCAFRGFGEIELHLHHGHDTEEAFAAALREGVAWFNRCGAMLTAEASPRQLFAYLAGNSALDNGAGDDSLSGCDTELRALARAGCYADFTFPNLGSPAQPRTTNSIYYAAEDGRQKSYDTGERMRVGGAPSGDLLIFQGPTAVNWAQGRFDDGAVEDASPAAPERLAAWLAAHVHVAGRPEWVFVKLHTHALQNRKSFLGACTDVTFAAMGRQWDRPPFRLHYVTAREAYNIARAAEAGRDGDPNDYRDFLIPPPANRVAHCDAPWRLRRWADDSLCVEVFGNGPARLVFAGRPLRSVAGCLRRVEADFRAGALVGLRVEADGPVAVEPAACRPVLVVRGNEPPISASLPAP